MEIYRRSREIFKSNPLEDGETVHDAFFDRTLKEEEK
jgi:hypothetical protein